MQQDSIHTDDTINTHKIAGAVSEEAKSVQNRVLAQSGEETQHAGHNEYTANPILDLQHIFQGITQKTTILEKIREQEQQHFEDILKETDILRQKLNTLVAQHGSTSHVL